MAAFPPYPQRTGAAQQKQKIRTPGHDLFANWRVNPSAQDPHEPCPLQPVYQFAYSPEVVLEGYTFFKADAVLPEQATWRKAERTPMLRKQTKLYEMMRQRAFKISASQQYARLEAHLQRHISQLIHDKRAEFPGYEWTCSYAKPHKRSARHSSEALSARKDHCEIVAMDVIIMRRPLAARYCRTPMGDLVDLNVPLNAWRHSTQSNHTLHTETDIPVSPSSRLEEEELEMLKN